jgi:predicted nucleic acid-binding Zn ribbon protein
MTDDIDAAASAALRRAVRGKPGPRRRSQGTSQGPQPVRQALDEFVSASGWTTQAAVARVTQEWPSIVGPELADHVTPGQFDDGRLVLQADSTAWATQVKLLLPGIQQALDRALGPGVVTRLEIRGPQAPSWVKGPRRVKGRGPRDTYG